MGGSYSFLYGNKMPGSVHRSGNVVQGDGDPQTPSPRVLGERFAFPQEPCALFLRSESSKYSRAEASSGTKNACTCFYQMGEVNLEYEFSPLPCVVPVAAAPGYARS